MIQLNLSEHRYQSVRTVQGLFEGQMYLGSAFVDLISLPQNPFPTQLAWQAHLAMRPLKMHQGMVH